MIFWVPLSLQKKVFGPSQHSSMFHFLQCFPTILSLKFFQNIKHFQSPNAHNIPMYFFVSFNILFKPSTLNAWCSLFPPQKNHVQPSVPNVFNVPFQHPCYYCLLF
jgi:hypothetical protein